MFDDQGRRNTTEIKTLTTTEDRRQNLFRIRRREEELHVRRRLLQRLQQRIEGRRREHVNLVDDVDFELARGRRELGRIPQFPHLIDTVV